ncbi:TauD/TfdA family dioxygenase [Gammaproteobacteria bacterium]|nr:TauD/TfdA family dioxygenase [Gammaproteobacteria bacterium]
MKFVTPESSSNLGVTIEDIALNEILSDQEVHDVRAQWVKYGVAVFPKQSLTLEEYENFSQLFGPYGQEPFLIPMQEHPHIVKLHRKPDEEAAHFGGLGIQIGRFNMLLPLQPCSTQKLSLLRVEILFLPIRQMPTTI